MSILYNFLQRNTASKSDELPLVHTTRARHLRRILGSQKIIPQECDVFKGDNLTYMFLGRPAYKFSLHNDAEHWQLPVCFVMKYDMDLNPKRVFPFDSGGFSRKFMPSFISDMDLEDFEISKDKECGLKIVGTFFGSARNYFRLKAPSNDPFVRRHDLSMLEAELLALHRLTTYRGRDFDDRQFTVEYQFSDEINLANNKIDALIVPSPYLDDEKFWEQVSSSFDCEVLGYDCYPLNPETYYYGIYSRVESYLFAKGILK